mgnify:CR=1 FL=1
MSISIKSEADLVGLRVAGRLAADVLAMIAQHVKPGVSTEALDDICNDYIVNELNVIPANVGYHGFTKTTCISPNTVVCHGIPSADDILKDGDIVNIDVTVILDGWHGDSSRMYPVGKVSVKAARLMDVTYEALMRAIDVVKPGVTLGDIGAVIQTYVEGERFSVVRDFCGHGLGRTFHAPPSVLHYGRPGEGARLEAGMFFTIEPMVNAGRHDTKILADGWTAVTRDRSLSAQFEHSLGVTDEGCEIFTLSPAGYTKPPYA